MEFPGLTVDTVQMEWKLPVDKIKKICVESQAMMRQEEVSGRALAQLVGKMNATSQVIPLAPLFNHHLQMAFFSGQPDPYAMATHAFLQDWSQNQGVCQPTLESDRSGTVQSTNGQGWHCSGGTGLEDTTMVSPTIANANCNTTSDQSRSDNTEQRSGYLVPQLAAWHIGEIPRPRAFGGSYLTCARVLED